MKKNITVFGRYLFILFFLYYYVGITAFVHTHHYSIYTVTHSHPFLPGAQHSHSLVDFETVGVLNMLIVDVAPVTLFPVFLLSLIGVIFEIYRYPTPYKDFHHPSFRAPPVV